MPTTHSISPEGLTIGRVEELLDGQYPLQLSPESRERVRHCKAFLMEKLSHPENRYYGINTGFGSLYNIRISAENIEKLQTNLVESHACGTGEEVPPEVVKLILLLKIQNLSYGNSAISEAVVDRLIGFYNEGVLPIIYQQGSLGASGDLAPLAHLSLPLLGEGEVRWKGEKIPGSVLREKLGWEPLRLGPKEGLALLNGTQFSTAYALWAVVRSRHLLALAQLTAALSIDAFDCHLSPFDPRLHHLRSHPGQIATAEAIRQWLADSEIARREKTSLQDPYSFRCVPQVHGASMDALRYVEKTVLTEINSVTDNPIIFPDSDGILSGGNFHAQPIALALDFLAIALAELGSISERRTYLLISGKRDLPAFLSEKAGLHSGLMIPQYTAASITSQNKQLCTPASVDSIMSSNGQEDHVSMAANAGTKAYRVVENLERLLAIEFMTAAQALEFRRPLRSSDAIENILSQYRNIVPKLEEDRILYTDIEKTCVFLRNLRW